MGYLIAELLKRRKEKLVALKGTEISRVDLILITNISFVQVQFNCSTVRLKAPTNT